MEEVQQLLDAAVAGDLEFITELLSRPRVGFDAPLTVDSPDTVSTSACNSL